MNRRPLLGLVLVALAVFAGLALWQRYASRTPEGELVLAGNVRAEVRAVRAPAIAYPIPDYAAGTGTATPGAAPAAARQTASRSRAPQVSGTIARMYVAEGDRVETGAVVAQLDTTLLDLGVEQAKADAARAHAEVGLLDDALDTVDDNRVDLRDARRKLSGTRSDLLEARSGLLGQLALLGKMPVPPSLPPSAPPGPVPPDPAKLAARLRAALAQVEAGLAKIDAGKAKLDSGTAKLADAETQLTDAREVLGILAGARELGVKVAEARVQQATVRSPVSGVVVDARRAGTVAMVGAPLVRVRPDSPTFVDTYVAPEQLGAVRVGDVAEVDYDSNTGARLRGRVSRIAERAGFPPAAFPTAIVHMTRAVRVTITLGDGGWAPPGTPADVTILTGPARERAVENGS